jgi:hypothetical protein
MPKMRDGYTDVATYRELSQPFGSTDACNAALKAFYEDVREARKKHKIRDVLVVTSGSVTYEGDDGEGEWVTMASFGNSATVPSLAAYAYGQATAEEREHLNKLLGGKGTRRRD